MSFFNYKNKFFEIVYVFLCLILIFCSHETTHGKHGHTDILGI